MRWQVIIIVVVFIQYTNGNRYYKTNKIHCKIHTSNYVCVCVCKIQNLHLQKIMHPGGAWYKGNQTLFTCNQFSTPH